MIDRRTLVGFDPDHFAKRSEVDGPTDALTAFRYAYHHNLWSGDETPSGPGSSRVQTAAVVDALPALCRQYGITSLLDVPCGTFSWMAKVALSNIRYTGGDIVPEIVEQVNRQHGAPDRRFLVLDLTRSPLPPADLLLCRDGLVHLSHVDIAAAVANIRRSDVEYLLATTFTAEPGFRDIVTGDWRPLNLEAPPLSFPRPIELIPEQCTEQDGAFADKCLGLWRVRDLPDLGTNPG